VIDRLIKEADILSQRSADLRTESLRSVERGAGISSIAQVISSALEQSAHDELAQIEPKARRSLIGKLEQFLVVAARKYDVQANELRGRAGAYEEQATRLREIVTEHQETLNQAALASEPEPPGSD
jgi:hypothetical protein